MEWVIILAKILLINIVLSGDNAVVIAMASRHLPEAERKQAIWWGSLAAIGLRIVLVFVAVWLLQVPYLQALGALMLMYIAIKLLDEEADGDARHELKKAAGLWSAVWTILLADFVMSLDNVLAIAAIAKGHMLLIMLGVLLSIPLIVWGSSLIVRLLDKYPILIVIGAAILGYTAGEMLLGDHKLQEWVARMPHHIHLTIPILCTLFALIPGMLKLRKAGH